DSARGRRARARHAGPTGASALGRLAGPRADLRGPRGACRRLPLRRLLPRTRARLRGPAGAPRRLAPARTLRELAPAPARARAPRAGPRAPRALRALPADQTGGPAPAGAHRGRRGGGSART